MRALRQTAVVFICSLLAALVVATVNVSPATAHDELVSSTPRDQQTLDRAPSTVVLTFDEPPVALGTEVVVSGPSGDVQQGPPRLVDRTVIQDLRSGTPAGTYTVSWRVTSADGHPVSGRFSFTARSAAPGTPAPSASGTPGPSTQPDSGRVPAWLWLVGGLALVLVAPRAAQRFGQPRRP